MVVAARERVAELHAQGLTEARLYGANDNDGVGGIGSVFLLLDEPEVYGLPPDPRVPTADLPTMIRRAAGRHGRHGRRDGGVVPGQAFVTHSEFDEVRPPELAASRRGGPAGSGDPDARARRGDGGREVPMVPDVEFTSYYGRPVVKAPPWGEEIRPTCSSAGWLVGPPFSRTARS